MTGAGGIRFQHPHHIYPTFLVIVLHSLNYLSLSAFHQTYIFSCKNSSHILRYLLLFEWEDTNLIKVISLSKPDFQWKQFSSKQYFLIIIFKNFISIPSDESVVTKQLTALVGPHLPARFWKTGSQIFTIYEHN